MNIVKPPEDLSVGDIKKEMLEKKALPIGLTQFTEWSDRIIAGAGLNLGKDCGWEGDQNELRFLLCEVLQHIGGTEAFKEDAYFILRLRNILVKETAFKIFQNIKNSHEAQKQKLAEDTAPKLGVVDGGVLEDQKV